MSRNKGITGITCTLILTISVSCFFLFGGGFLSAKGLHEAVKLADEINILVEEDEEAGLHDFGGSWGISSREAHFIVRSNKAQKVYDPFAPVWEGSITMKGAVNGEIGPHVAQVFLPTGDFALVVQNKAMGGSRFPEFALQLYNGETFGASILNIMIDEDTYRCFEGGVEFEHTGARIRIPAAVLRDPSAGREGEDEEVRISGELTAPEISVSPGEETILAGMSDTLFGPPSIEKIVIGDDGACSGGILFDDLLLDFSGNIVLNEESVTFVLGEVSEGMEFPYRFVFHTPDEFDLIWEMPIDDLEGFEADFGFRERTLISALYRVVRTYTRN